jgi:hypothetical protein
MIRSLSRIRRRRTVAAVVMFFLTALAIGFLGDSGDIWTALSGQSTISPAPALPGLLHQSPLTRVTKLYPRPADSQEPAKDRSNFVRTHDGGGAEFIKNTDQSSQDVFYQDDGKKIAFSNAYYAVLAGEQGRRKKNFLVYAADGVHVEGEEWYRLNSSREKIGHRLQDGGYVASTLFADGETAATEILTGPPDPSANDYEPKLLREQRWYEEGHVLAYRNELKDDGTREEDTFDKLALPVMEKLIGRRGVFGTKIKVFHPGSRQVLLESLTSLRSTDANFYSLDGSLQLTQTLTPYGIGVTYFGGADKIPLFQQSWFLMDEKKNGQPVLHLWRIAELEPNGEPKRNLTFNNGKLETETWLNVTIDGIAYASMTVNYNEYGTIVATELAPVGKGQTKTTISPPPFVGVGVVPAAELAEPDLHYNLPIPPEPRPDRADH